MAYLTRYYLWFAVLCVVLTMIVGVLAAKLPKPLGGILTAFPYLISMISVLYIFLRREQRAPDAVERKRLLIGYCVIYWGLSILGVVLGIFIFAQSDVEVLQTFQILLNQPLFLGLIVAMALILTIPLFLISWWFYGAQAQRMAAKMFQD